MSTRKEIKYKNPLYLNDLAMRLIDKSKELSLTFEPNIAKFREKINALGPFIDPSYGYPTIKMPNEKEREKADFQLIEALKACKEHNITPLLSLQFQGWLSSMETKFVGPTGGNMHFSSSIFYHPSIFIGQKKQMWYSIKFNHINSQKEMEYIKESIPLFVNEGYLITFISALLDPSILGEKYEREIVLMASRGDIIISSEGDITFNINKLPKKKSPRSKDPIEKIIQEITN